MARICRSWLIFQNIAPAFHRNMPLKGVAAHNHRNAFALGSRRPQRDDLLI